MKIPNADKLIVTHIGSVRLFGNIVLDHVLYAPSIYYDLISISWLTKV